MFFAYLSRDSESLQDRFPVRICLSTEVNVLPFEVSYAVGFSIVYEIVSLDEPFVVAEYELLVSRSA